MSKAGERSKLIFGNFFGHRKVFDKDLFGKKALRIHTYSISKNDSERFSVEIKECKHELLKFPTFSSPFRECHSLPKAQFFVISFIPLIQSWISKFMTLKNELLLISTGPLFWAHVRFWSVSGRSFSFYKWEPVLYIAVCNAHTRAMFRPHTGLFESFCRVVVNTCWCDIHVHKVLVHWQDRWLKMN